MYRQTVFNIPIKMLLLFSDASMQVVYMRSLHRRPSLDLVGNPFADVIRRHEQRHQMRRAGAREGGLDVWRERDESSPEPPDVELDGDSYVRASRRDG